MAKNKVRLDSLEGGSKFKWLGREWKAGALWGDGTRTATDVSENKHYHLPNDMPVTPIIPEPEPPKPGDYFPAGSKHPVDGIYGWVRGYYCGNKGNTSWSPFVLISTEFGTVEDYIKHHSGIDVKAILEANKV